MTEMLVEEFLELAESLVESAEASERLLQVLCEAAKLWPDDLVLLCRSARLLYRYGLLHCQERFFLLALDKLKCAEEKNPLFIHSHGLWLQLWGNILIQLAKRLNDLHFFEMALDKYTQAESANHPDLADLDWDCAEAWILLGQMSGEHADFQRGLAKFQRAAHAGIRSLFFKLDYADAFVQMGKLTGNPLFLEQAVSYYDQVILDSYSPHVEQSFAHMLSWKKRGLCLKLRYELTHHLQHLEEADKAFRNAVLSDPSRGDLWLEWGHVFLHAGWIQRDIKLIERGLEKLTSPKIKECNPLRTSYLLGMGLALFGLFLDNFQLLKDGQARIAAALTLAPDHAQLCFASGFAELALGLYFSDDTQFEKAACIFLKGIQEDNASIESWYALFQTYFAWGLRMKNRLLIQKAISAITRVCELRPFSYVYVNDWASALLRLSELEENVAESCIYSEEAEVLFSRASQLYQVKVSNG